MCWSVSRETARPFLLNFSAPCTEIFFPGTNRKYTFRFNGLDKLGTYGNITIIESQTYEDPMILAMNLSKKRRKNRNI